MGKEPELMKLPVDLLIHVFTACPSIQCAVLLSSVNEKLHDIWLQHYRYIVTSILIRHQVPDYMDAISVAIHEARLFSTSSVPDYEKDVALAINDELPLSASSGQSPPPNLWIPRLVFHIDSSSRICAKYFTWLSTLHKDRRSHARAKRFTSPPASYYMTWKLVIAYHLPPLQIILNATLKSASTDTLTTHYDISRFIANGLDEEESSRQGVYKDDYTADDEFEGTANKAEWQFAAEALRDAYLTRIWSERSQAHA